MVRGLHASEQLHPVGRDLPDCSWPQGLGVLLSSSCILPSFPLFDLLVKGGILYKQTCLLLLSALCIAWSLCSAHLQQQLLKSQGLGGI